MKVSIIIPTYNYANYIFEALESIEAQNYPLELIEVIIVDDGSSDETPQLFKNYQGPLNLNYHYQENAGKAAATQKGIDLSTGEIIFNLDADDYFFPDKIRETVKIYQKYPNVTHVANPALIIEGSNFNAKENIPHKLLNKPIKGSFLIDYFLEKRILFGGGSTFSARSTVLKAISIPNKINMYVDEFLVFIASCSGFSFFISDTLSVWRIHKKNYSKEEVYNKDKQLQLLNSSTEMLKTIKNTKLFNDIIKKKYYLKHLVRELSYKENTNQKNIKDSLNVTFAIFFRGYNVRILHTYRLFYRLLPSSIVRYIKKHS